MHTRERGAVNTMVFFITLVLMLGAFFFGYTQHDDAKNLRAQLASAKSDVAKSKLDRLVRDHLLEDIRKVIGETGTYKGRDGYNYEEDVKEAGGAQLPELANVTIPSKVTEKVAEFAKDLGIPSSLTNGVADLLNQVTTTYRAKNTELADAKTQSTRLASEVAAAQRATAEVTTERGKESQAAAKSVADLRQHVTAEFANWRTQVDATRAEVAQRRTEISELSEKHKGELRVAAKEKSLLEARIASAAAVVKLHNPPEAADGDLLSASAATDLGYISLGTKDMLPSGAVFRVTDPRDGKLKAMAEVVGVERDRAQVRLYGVNDKFDYPVTGDKISSPIYSPGVRRNVALLGRFGYPYTKDTIKTVFKSLGNEVHDKVGPGVDLVIIGDETLSAEGDSFVKVEDTDDYKTAVALGVEFAPVHKIRQFLKQ
jgi:hypothetical protein